MCRTFSGSAKKTNEFIVEIFQLGFSKLLPIPSWNIASSNEWNVPQLWLLASGLGELSSLLSTAFSVPTRTNYCHKERHRIFCPEKQTKELSIRHRRSERNHLFLKIVSRSAIHQGLNKHHEEIECSYRLVNVNNIWISYFQYRERSYQAGTNELAWQRYQTHFVDDFCVPVDWTTQLNNWFYRNSQHLYLNILLWNRTRFLRFSSYCRYSGALNLHWSRSIT